MGQKSLIIDRNVEMQTRDGVTLRADVIRPNTEERLPVLLQRTPYGKTGGTNAFAVMAAERGYVVVNQDTRGRWDSDGDGTPFVHEKADGYDTVHWAAALPWSSGDVGMFGGSYVGYTQLAAASQQPPALKALVPAVTFCDVYRLIYPGGAFGLGVAATWGLGAQAAMAIERIADQAEKQERMSELIAEINGLSRKGGQKGDTFFRLPLKEMPLIGEGGVAPFLSDLLSYPTGSDPHWQSVLIPFDAIRVPMFQMGGWYDIFAADTLLDYAGIAAAGNANQKVLMGPWLHGPLSGLVGDVDFGFQADDATLMSADLQLKWFDRWLKDVENGIDEGPPIRLFVMGDNVWRDEAAWPLARSKPTACYLHSEGGANTLHGNGRLSFQAPGEEPVDTFVYDPLNPVPTLGGGLCCSGTGAAAGAFDQREIEARPDVLVYTSDVLPEDLEVTGYVVAKLWAATSAVDTDFTAKLVDVGSCGYARNVADGVIRARFRLSTAEAVPIEPNRAYEYTIEIGPTSNIFKAGHRMRLEISSSNFPKVARNLNTGAEIGATSETRSAVQAILHDAEHASRVILPVVPR